MRRGASWTAAYHVQLTVAAVARPVRSSMVPLVLLAAELSWVVARPDRRHLPGGASSRHPASRVAVVDTARTPAMASVAGRCPACGVHPSAVVVRVRRSGRPVSRASGVHPSGVQCVQCPARPVSTVRRPAGCCPPPSVRTRPPRSPQAAAVGTSSRRRATVTTRTGRAPVGCHVLERLDARPSRPGRGRCCRGRASVRGSVADPGQVGCARGRA